MAKNAVKVRELKRKKLVEKYAAKRKELKAKGDWEGLDKLPRNSSAVRLHNRCNLSGRPKGNIINDLDNQTCLELEM